MLKQGAQNLTAVFDSEIKKITQNIKNNIRKRHSSEYNCMFAMQAVNSFSR